MTEVSPHPAEDDWIELVSGRRFHLGGTPIFMAGEIHPEDVAYSLSRLCRYNGHTRRFYSVAEHTIVMADYLRRRGWGPQACLTALHHDDAEYIVGDLPRPVKATLPSFKALEARIEEAVALRFGTIWPLPDWLKVLDARIVCDERASVMNSSPNAWGVDALKPLGVHFMPVRGRLPGLLRGPWLDRHRRWTREMRGSAAT